ncbi:MAG TPA: hypothetical protein VFN30_04345 [Chitinophagaceae bacterium]|nr:hypothetical protein [Chitinophagaceae bacterium]
MKKHIQKKFLHETELPQEVIDLMSKSELGIPLDDQAKIKSIPRGMTPFLTTEDNKFFKAFTFRHNNQIKLIPEPDPILVYFNAAYLNYIQIKDKRKEVFDKLSGEKLSEVMIKELYDYFGTTSSFIILLFTAIEALMNRCIPNDYTYKRVTSRKTELFNKKQIEEFIPFDEKLKDVLADATKKNYSTQHPKKYTHISNLKEFRNMIVHTREAEGQSTYDYVYKKALTFNYEETLDVVKDFCNFYTKEDFITDCNCSFDW